jgi:hypothetical protein
MVNLNRIKRMLHCLLYDGDISERKKGILMQILKTNEAIGQKDKNSQRALNTGPNYNINCN